MASHVCEEIACERLLSILRVEGCRDVRLQDMLIIRLHVIVILIKRLSGYILRYNI